IKMFKKKELDLLTEIELLQTALTKCKNLPHREHFSISMLACHHTPAQIRKTRLKIEKEFKLFGAASPGQCCEYGYKEIPDFVKVNYKIRVSARTPVEPYDPLKPGFDRPKKSVINPSAVNPASVKQSIVKQPSVTQSPDKPVLSNQASIQFSKENTSLKTKPKTVSNGIIQQQPIRPHSPLQELQANWINDLTLELEEVPPISALEASLFEPPRKIKTAMERLKEVIRPFEEVNERPLGPQQRRRTFHAYDKNQQVFKIYQTRNRTTKKPTGKYLRDFLHKFLTSN
ncbi:hypothetical protein KQX54_013599, partial [Cotesia glomerata]